MLVYLTTDAMCKKEPLPHLLQLLPTTFIELSCAVGFIFPSKVEVSDYLLRKEPYVLLICPLYSLTRFLLKCGIELIMESFQQRSRIQFLASKSNPAMHPLRTYAVRRLKILLRQLSAFDYEAHPFHLFWSCERKAQFFTPASCPSLIR